MTGRRTILVPGTHGYDGTLVEGGSVRDWFNPLSRFFQCLEARELRPLPFVWSTSVGGIGFGDGDLNGWRSAGLNLFRMAVPHASVSKDFIPGDELIVIAHSHGGQVALAAAAAGLRVALLVTVCTPVRSDVWCGGTDNYCRWETKRKDPCLAHQARPNITRWVHLHGNWKDRWQWRGALFDSWNPLTWFRSQRAYKLADRNHGESVGHDAYLRDPKWFGVLAAALDEAPPWPVEVSDVG